MRYPKFSMRTALHTVAVLVTFSIAAQTAAAKETNLAHWPNWRGPLGTGAAPKASPPVEWSATKNIKWKAAIEGRGTSSPVVWGDKIFLQTAIATGEKPEPEEPVDAQKEAAEKVGGRVRGFFGGGQKPDQFYEFVLLCLDRKTGKTLWRQVACKVVPHEGHHRDHGFASFSPVTDGRSVIAFFGSRGIYCYDMDGKLQWKKDLGRQKTRLSFGEASSPALFDDVVVVTWDHEGEDDFIIALDRRTGKELWRQSREEPTSWATPLVVEHQGRQQVITPGTKQVRAYDLKTGEMLWHCDGLTPNAIPSPVAADGVVYVTSGFRGSKLLAIQLGHTGDLTDSDAILWKHNKNTPYVPSPLLCDGKLYFYSSNNAILSCFDIATGKAIFGPQRLQGISNVYASPIAAAGRIYLVGRDGVTLVAEHVGDDIKVLATNTLGEPVDASPAAVGSELFLRGDKHLFCIAPAE